SPSTASTPAAAPRSSHCSWTIIPAMTFRRGKPPTPRRSRPRPLARWSRRFQTPCTTTRGAPGAARCVACWSMSRQCTRSRCRFKRHPNRPRRRPRPTVRLPSPMLWSSMFAVSRKSLVPSQEPRTEVPQHRSPANQLPSPPTSPSVKSFSAPQPLPQSLAAASWHARGPPSPSQTLTLMTRSWSRRSPPASPPPPRRRRSRADPHPRPAPSSSYFGSPTPPRRRRERWCAKSWPNCTRRFVQSRIAKYCGFAASRVTLGRRLLVLLRLPPPPPQMTSCTVASRV
ncbi:hypothetical protein HK405_001295, partial [Cladochytrium tenue]